MEAVAALADVHADLNATTKQEGTTALLIAIINIHYDLANLLLEQGRRSERRRLHRHDGAVRGGRHAHAGQHADPALAEAARHARRGRHRQVAARARREPERPAEEADHRPSSQSGRRRPADGRRDGAGARGEGQRRPDDESAARRRRGRDPRARQPHDDGDAGGRRQRRRSRKCSKR